ncbi:MAG: hypothetical protein ACOC5D_06850 [Thermoplasmatota archaeon]
MKKLDSYELMSIGLIVTGIIVILAGRIMFYTFNIHMVHFSSGQRRFFGEMISISSGVSLIGTFIMGIGLFLSFRRLDNKIDVHEYFQYINYTYVILVSFNLLYIIRIFIFDPLDDPSLATHMIYLFGSMILPTIASIFLIIMIVLIFLKFYKKEANYGY